MDMSFPRVLGSVRVCTGVRKCGCVCVCPHVDQQAPVSGACCIR